MNGKLEGKSILFFSVQTFGLEIHIKHKLEDLGAYVLYFDERPKNNNFTKGIIRLNRKLIENTINRYYSNILTSFKKRI